MIGKEFSPSPFRGLTKKAVSADNLLRVTTRTKSNTQLLIEEQCFT